MFVLLMPTFHKDNYYDDLHSFRTESFPHTCDWKDHCGKMSIQVSFMEDTQAIAGHTCTGQLVFPRGIGDHMKTLLLL